MNATVLESVAAYFLSQSHWPPTENDR